MICVGNQPTGFYVSGIKNIGINWVNFFSLAIAVWIARFTK